MMYPYITLPDETEIVHSQIVTESGNATISRYSASFFCRIVSFCSIFSP